MSGTAQRPRGDPRVPPDWLNEQELPCAPLERVWYRCAFPARPLIEWDNRATSRYSGPKLLYRSLYLAEDTPTGFWECYGDDLIDREPEMRSISATAYGARVIVEFHLPAGLQMLNLTDARALRVIGADGATFKAAYSVTQPWADALMRHPQAPDGLIYESRLNNGRRCLALFEKSGRGAQIRAKGLRDMADDAPIRVEMVREKIAIAHA